MVLASESKFSSARGAPGGAFTSGSLIVNADDWGRSREATDRTLECRERGSISSVSAMVFMEDSVRAAALARERSIDAGLHLNFTAPFSGGSYPAMLGEHQQRIGRRLRRHRFAQVMFYPELSRSFEYVVSAQLDEFCRLYGSVPQRLDGHHHMHLCANVLLGQFLRAGTIVRRNFSFEPGEKSFLNRLYRHAIDRLLSRRHLVTDFFFSLAPLAPLERLDRIFTLARDFVVEIETHPLNPDEYRFLVGGEIFRQISVSGIAPCFAVSTSGNR